MSTIVISGASGSLAREVTRFLREQYPEHQLRLVTRTPQKLAGVETDGASVFKGDYNAPDELEEAYRGADVLFLVSAVALIQRVQEHRNAIEAAKKAGIRHIVYTSYVGIHPRNPNMAARDHIITEADLRASGIDHTILRDATFSHWIYELSILSALQTGTWMSVKGEGRLAPVAKEDAARSAAECLANPNLHVGATYELSGPDLFNFRQIAELAQEVFATPFAIQEVTPEERLAFWDSMGVPRDRSAATPIHADAEWLASDELVSGETAIAQQGFQGVLSDHVWMITGRRPRSLRSVLEEIASSPNRPSIIADVSAAKAAAAS